MYRLICHDCAVKLNLEEDWKKSRLGNWNDKCMECGKETSLMEVIVREKLNKFQFINRKKYKKEKLFLL